MNPNDPVFKINQMMQNSKYLIDSELDWLKKMDKTIAGFYVHLDATPRQAEVINDIYKKYLKRGGPPLTDAK